MAATNGAVRRCREQMAQERNGFMNGHRRPALSNGHTRQRVSRTSTSDENSSDNSDDQKYWQGSKVNTKKGKENPLRLKGYMMARCAWLFEPEYFVPEKGTVVAKGEVGRNSDRIHSVADSLFSTSSGFTNYLGLLNLGIVLLVLSFTRVALENLIKYGILIKPLNWASVIVQDPYNWPSFSLILLANVFILTCFFNEVLLSKTLMAERVGFYIHVLNLSAVLLFPAVVILYIHPFPLFSSIALGVYTILFLKLVSYVMVNSWCRDEFRRHTPKPGRSRFKSYVHIQDVLTEGNVTKNGNRVPVQHYPDNLHLADIYYFMLAPTLSYELNYPRSARVRKRFLMKRGAEMIFLLGLMLSLVQQWIVPTVHNSMVPFKGQHYSKIAERIMKLAVPNHIIWLIFFYWFFHSCLNVVAELLRFGDRVFYRDWWNSETVQSFWQNWNIPVHRWATRHLYKPLLSRGWSKLSGSIAVFFVSAFFHEYLVSVPLRMFRLWAFMSMLGQVPFAMFVNQYLHGKYGNMAVWLSLIMGQPIAILMYYHDYYIINLEQLGWLPFSNAVPTLSPGQMPVP